MKKEQIQPAKLNYFFGPGFNDLKRAIMETWEKNSEDVRTYMEAYDDAGIASPDGIYNLFCALSVAVFGTLFFLIISAVIFAVLLIFHLMVYILFTLVWLVDRGYLEHRKIFTACYVCKTKYLIPTYICPKCGARHSNLTPGKYGILYRTCECGEQLPSIFFMGRKNLAAVCPECERNGVVTYLSDKESRPICIPIVGARSVGKTAYITAFSQQFISNAPDKDFEIEMYNKEKEVIYNQIRADYMNGTTRMTARSHDIRETSSVSFSFFVKHKSLKPDRLIHIYDIAGEVFTDNEENEIPKHYDYCNGIVLVIDPFSIPSVMNRYDTMINLKDRAGIGKTNINIVIDSFINKLRMATGLDDRTMLDIPLAVVLGKMDSGDIIQEFSEEKIAEMQNRYPDKKPDRYDAIDRLCREFLAENDMMNFISIINNRFSLNRYFICSAIGHTRDDGEYRPQGVYEPLEWICSITDPQFASLWSSHEISKKSSLRE